MAKRRSLETELSELSQLRTKPVTTDTVTKLATALAGGVSYLVQRAAKVAGELAIEELADPLAEAFERLMDGPDSADKGCIGKTAISKTLCEMAADQTHVYLRGIEHVQYEPVYGGRADTASELRGHCGMGLAAVGHPEATLRLAHLLADTEMVARQAAARALGCSGRPAAVPLLHFKILSGDPEAAVIGECFSAALLLDPDDSFRLVARFVHHEDSEVASEAALALGESRLPKTFDVLATAWDSCRSASTRAMFLQAMALLRDDVAEKHLVRMADEGPPIDAAAAVAALGIFRHDQMLRERISDIVRRRDEPKISRSFEAAFDL